MSVVMPFTIEETILKHLQLEGASEALKINPAIHANDASSQELTVQLDKC